jgi:DNA-binding response OmpR family regulator
VLGMTHKTILLVEDEPALLEAVKLKFDKEGVGTYTAITGEQALEVLKKVNPTLVWLDILLPKMNGLEVLKSIREDPKLKDQPVIVVSVSGGEEKIKQAFGMNVLDYLIKSEYTIDEIVDKTMILLEKIP